MTSEELHARLKAIAKAEPGPFFMEIPERWYEDLHWRCVNDHVSTRYLKTEEGDQCLACYGPLFLTFPEDEDGPLKDGK